ncbi:MAG: histone deacetylase [Planctomycetes bacterium]|nr:histone deacetylase [Planctomycetota bacterium]
MITPALRPVGLVYHEQCLRHVPGAGHPDAPNRLDAIRQGLAKEGLMDKLARIEPAEMRPEYIEAVHTRQYIEIARQDIISRKKTLSTGDTAVCEESFDAARRAVGCVVAGVEAVAAGKVQSVFCAIRPPGHHSTPSAGMGFCVFNNAAIAARHAQLHCGVGKVFILDWDVHHGNGTQDAFWEDGSVLACSIHQDGLYPMPITGQGHADETGAGKGLGCNMNIPLPAGSGDEDIVAVFHSKIAPAAARFKPDLIVISAGFDSRVGDALGDFTITDDGFSRLTRLTMGLMDSPRIVSVLEGGYDPVGLASAACRHISTLLTG